MSEEIKVDKMMDLKGLPCPMPVVKLRRAIKGMEVGEILEMIATDPGVVPDMQAWENQTRHEVLLTENQGEGKFRFLIKKTH